MSELEKSPSIAEQFKEIVIGSFAEELSYHSPETVSDFVALLQRLQTAGISNLFGNDMVDEMTRHGNESAISLQNYVSLLLSTSVRIDAALLLFNLDHESHEFVTTTDYVASAVKSLYCNRLRGTSSDSRTPIPPKDAPFNFLPKDMTVYIKPANGILGEGLLEALYTLLLLPNAVNTLVEAINPDKE